MKSLLPLAATLLTIALPLQENAIIQPDLMVVKFTCARYESGGHMIRSVQDPDSNMNAPISINQVIKNEPQEVVNRRDMQERRAELKAGEINAELSKQRGSIVYHYRLEVRNTSARSIKNFAWSYQPGEVPDPSDRQFFCAIDAKSNENKILDLYTPLAPTRLLDASKSNDKSEKNDKQNVLINLIEYTDGTVWKRQAWNPKTFPAESKEKVTPGKCIGL